MAKSTVGVTSVKTAQPMAAISQGNQMAAEENTAPEALERRKFLQRKWENAETSIAYHSMLISLGQGASELSPAVVIPAVETMEGMAWLADTIWSGTQDDAKAAMRGAAYRPLQLPPVQEFVVAGGDWMAFRHCFKAAWLSIGWTKWEALRALLMALDDDALTVFQAIPEEPHRSTRSCPRRGTGVKD
ncbi:unnamed protein product [Lampetra fluviatilis]